VTTDALIRTLAAVAAIAVVAGPRLVALVRSAVAGGRQEVSPLADAHTILEIARRLQVAGKAKGVELCQQLIDVMLQEGP
jgi:hypothetical protein